MASGESVSPSLSVPGFASPAGQIGWLHSTDLIVTADFTMYYVVQHKLPGSKPKEKCAALHQEMQNLYRQNEIQDQMPHLTPGLLIKNGKTGENVPKLTAKAGQCRALTPLAATWAERYVERKILRTPSRRLQNSCRRVAACCLSKAGTLKPSEGPVSAWQLCLWLWLRMRTTSQSSTCSYSSPTGN